jgi:hypothetical protein
MTDRDVRMTRNVSVLVGDQERVAAAPSMSLRGDVSPRGDRKYVGDGQVITVSFGAGEADTPKAFDVALDHVPKSAMPRSGIKISSGTSLLAVINEWHGTAWTRNQVWFISTQDSVSQEMLIV